MINDTSTYEQYLESARLAVARRDRAAAEEALRSAVQAAERIPDAQLLLAVALVKLGELKQAEGAEAEAEAFFRRALDIGESAVGANDIALVPALTSLGAVRIARGAPEEAEPLLTRALAVSERHLGTDHPDLVVLLNDLSRLYLKQSAPAFAEPLLLRLYAIKRVKGEEHPEVATVLASLAAVRQALGRHESAEQLWRRVLDIRERTLAPNHFATATALEHLGETCAARGKLAEALRLRQRALGMRELTLDAGHPSLRAARERIADLQLQASEDPLGDGEASTPSGMTTEWRLPSFTTPTPSVSPFSAPEVRPTPTIAPAAASVPMAPAPRSAPQPVATIAAPAPTTVFTPTPTPAWGPSVPTALLDAPLAAVSTIAVKPAVGPLSKPEPATPPDAVPASKPMIAPVAAVVPAVEELRVELARRPAISLRDDRPGTLVPAQLAEPREAGEVEAKSRMFLVGTGVPAPMSIIMPAEAGELDLDPEEQAFALTDGPFAESRSRTLLATATAALARRRTPVIAAATATAALLLVAFGPRPQFGSQTDPTALSAAVPDVSSSTPAPAPDSVETAQRSANGTLDRASSSNDAPASRDRSRTAEASNSRPTPVADAPSSPPPSAPTLPSLGDLSRVIPTALSAQLDSAARAGASSRLSVGDVGGRPTFSSQQTTVEYATTSRVLKAALIGEVPKPAYPEALRSRANDLAGEVVFEFTVDTMGRADMSTVTVIRSSHELFTAAALRSIPRMRFFPAQDGGRKVRGQVQVPFRFSIYQEDKK